MKLKPMKIITPEGNILLNLNEANRYYIQVVSVTIDK